MAALRGSLHDSATRSLPEGTHALDQLSEPFFSNDPGLHMQADVRALRLERRKVAQERKQEAEQREAFEKQLKAKAEKTSQAKKEHGKTVAALQKQLAYYQNAKGAFQGRVCGS